MGIFLVLTHPPCWVIQPASRVLMKAVIQDWMVALRSGQVFLTYRPRAMEALSSCISGATSVLWAAHRLSTVRANSSTAWGEREREGGGQAVTLELQGVVLFNMIL